MKYCVVTGSGGLVGSESVHFFCQKGYTVIGIDNDMRSYFFGTSTIPISSGLISKYGDKYKHNIADIRNMDALEPIFKDNSEHIECIIHCAAQPSHDWAAKEPHTDFGINAVATLNLLELTRKYCSKASFIYMSTNKVYGDTPNRLPVVETETRYEIEGYAIDESMSIDQSKHSIFGASKVAADIMVQEYGRYFGMNTVVFRGGCITGPNHRGAQLHGFLSYIVKCIVNNDPYTIFGYKGKQVRDNIHSYDLVNAFWHYHNNPRPAAVYNMGGGRENSLSILETIEIVNRMTGLNWAKYAYVDENRSGDHIWYISDLTKFKTDYPAWSIKYPIDRIIRDIVCSYSPNITTAELIGGVGNQLFQIAAAYSISRELKTDIKFIKNQFSGCRQGSHPSTYYTTLYEKLNFVDSFPYPSAAALNEKEWTYTPIVESAKSLFNNASALMLRGYFQSEEYFKKHSREIKELFTPSIGFKTYLKTNTDLFSTFPELEHDNDYCFIGIRRGDYITHSEFHNPCGMTYYTAGMDKLKKERYYIMSDDIAWCKENFKSKDDRFRFIELSSDTDKLFAITLFRNYIISNSTFYWWGSFLSIYDDVNIVAPDKWIFGKDAPREKYWSIYRDSMSVLERPVETN